jgi:hypothetical protein
MRTRCQIKGGSRRTITRVSVWGRHASRCTAPGLRCGGRCTMRGYMRCSFQGALAAVAGLACHPPCFTMHCKLHSGCAECARRSQLWKMVDRAQSGTPCIQRLFSQLRQGRCQSRPAAVARAPRSRATVYIPHCAPAASTAPRGRAPSSMPPPHCAACSVSGGNKGKPLATCPRLT